MLQILLIEDNPGDQRLMQEAFNQVKADCEFHFAKDGVDAFSFLRKTGPYAATPDPHLILLDLNLSRKDGREFLQELKADEKLRVIPTIVLTTSHSEQDILTSYNLHANCYIIKPANYEELTHMAQAISEFWFDKVKLPGR